MAQPSTALTKNDIDVAMSRDEVNRTRQSKIKSI